MVQEGNVTLTIHGLAEDNWHVRAEVFLEKFGALLKSLKIAEAHLNGKKSYNLIITELKIGSALATVREKISIKKQIPSFGAPLVAEALNAVYNGDRRLDKFPADLIKSFGKLARGEKGFSHGEIEFAGSNVVRIDDYLAKQIERAIERTNGIEIAIKKYYEGIAFGVFDGVIKEIDSRGSLVKGKLIFTAGGKEVECIFRREDIPILRVNFDQRARVEAVAHYMSDGPLPVRLDVKNIEPVTNSPDLGRWRGALAGRKISRPGEL